MQYARAAHYYANQARRVDMYSAHLNTAATLADAKIAALADAEAACLKTKKKKKSRTEENQKTAEQQWNQILQQTQAQLDQAQQKIRNQESSQDDQRQEAENLWNTHQEALHKIEGLETELQDITALLTEQTKMQNALIEKNNVLQSQYDVLVQAATKSKFKNYSDAV